MLGLTGRLYHTVAINKANKPNAFDSGNLLANKQVLILFVEAMRLVLFLQSSASVVAFVGKPLRSWRGYHHTAMSSFIEHKVGSSEGRELLETAVMAKPCAWISVDQEKVALLDGYSVACMHPPTLMMASDAIPDCILKQLENSKRVTLSCATLREQHCLERAKNTLSFSEMGLIPQHREGYPSAVQSSPIHMHCHLVEKVELGEKGKTMVLLQIDLVVMKRKILTPPPPADAGGRNILALVDANKLQPIASMGHERYATMAGLHLLERPFKTEDGNWISDPFELSTVRDAHKDKEIPETVEWVTSEPSPLGFNPIKAIVVPRPIGWISTYFPETVGHVAPYSFFMDVARGDQPMVAFSAYRPTDGPLKDVQLDVQERKCFGVSTVSPELAVAMNLSSAPIERDESEFKLAGLASQPATLIDAPLVRDSNNVLECEYVKTVDVGGFSILIGKVLSIKVSESVLTNGKMDASKLKPVTRLGYTDEYAVIDQPVNNV